MAISGLLKKVFGSKSDRDMKLVKPVLDKVLAAYPSIDKLSNDELRARSAELKAKLRECEAPFEKRIEEIKAKLEEDIPVSEKEALATESDKLVKEEDEQIEKVLEEILPYIDAMNIDLKGFTDRYYTGVLGGDRQMVMRFIERAVQSCHVELTTLIIPGENDSEEEMREMCSWIAALGCPKDREPAEPAHDSTADGPGLSGAAKTAAETDGESVQKKGSVPLHISRFFPRFHMTDRDATSVKKIYRLADVAREQLEYVYTGNC